MYPYAGWCDVGGGWAGNRDSWPTLVLKAVIAGTAVNAAIN